MAFCSLPLRSTCTCWQRYCCATSESLGPAASERTLLLSGSATPLPDRSCIELLARQFVPAAPHGLSGHAEDTNPPRRQCLPQPLQIFCGVGPAKCAAPRYGTTPRRAEPMRCGHRPASPRQATDRGVLRMGDRGARAARRAPAVPVDPPGPPSPIRTREGLPPTRFPTARTRVRPGSGTS